MTQQPLALAPAMAGPTPCHCQNCIYAMCGDQRERTGLCAARRNGHSSLRWQASTAAKCAQYQERAQ